MQLKAQLSPSTVLAKELHLWLTMCSSDFCFGNHMAIPMLLSSGQYCFLVMSIRAHYQSLELLLFHFRIPCCSPVLQWNLIFWLCGDFFLSGHLMEWTIISKHCMLVKSIHNIWKLYKI